MDKLTVYSGIQPTGHMTLGNYIGSCSSWLKLQDDAKYNCIYSIVDLHAMTVRQTPSEFRARALSFYAQYLAMGLDPEKNILYFQSHVPEHSMLTWVLNCHTYIGEISRMTQFKEKSRSHTDNINVGLLDYPVLMAADILLFNTSIVPIGSDQKQHLELTRDIAVRFNGVYGDTFVIPEPYMKTEGAKITSLQDPLSKMSKSDPNPNAAISMLDDNDIIARKIKRAVTDSEAKVYLSDDKPGVKNLLTIISECEGISIERAAAECALYNYGELKSRVTDAVISVIAPVRERYSEIIGNKDELLKTAKESAEKAREIAFKTIRKVYKKVGLVQ